MSALPQISTGVKGLDEMLNGGFPRGRAILLSGGPGTGKTIFSLQFLASAARNGVNGVYVTLEEPANLIRDNVKAFGWNLEEKEKDNHLRIMELRVIPNEELSGRDRNEQLISSILKRILATAASINAEILVIDPLTSLTINEQRAGEKRRKIADLFNGLRESGCTAVLTSETISNGGEFYIEEFLADGVLRLDKTVNDFNLVRTVRIEKMRGLMNDDQPRRYVINEKGLMVYNTEPVKV
jgi:circadian clock protein KaiC